MPSAPVTTHRVVASIALPHPPYLRKLIRRSAGIWLLVRCMSVVVLMAGVAFFNLLPFDEGVATALHPGWVTRAVLVAVTAFLVWWDRRRARELVFYANLGTHPGWFWGASLLTASALDIVVQTLLDGL